MCLTPTEFINKWNEMIMLERLYLMHHLNRWCSKMISVLQELFIEMITKHAMDYTQKGRRKTVQRRDLGK